MVEHDTQHGYGEDEQPECGCGAVADYYGPDPYRSEMCDTYRGGPHGCPEGCSCWDEDWMCDACYQQACEDI